MGDKIYTGMNVFGYIMVAFQTDLLFKWVQIGLAIIMTLVGIAYKVWKWYKEAKADGEITKEEITELVEETKEDIKQVAEDTTELVKDIKENSK